VKQQSLPFGNEHELATALEREAAAFRIRHARRAYRAAAPRYRSEREERVARTYLDALRASLDEAKAKGHR